MKRGWYFGEKTNYVCDNILFCIFNVPETSTILKE